MTNAIPWISQTHLGIHWPTMIEELTSSQLRMDLITAAHIQCAAYAPEYPDYDVETRWAPENYIVAECMQVRNLYNATKADPAGQSAEGEFVFRPFPLDRQVKELLRPRRGRPRVG